MKGTHLNRLLIERKIERHRIQNPHNQKINEKQ
jgi:hypothetical protein